MSWAIKVIENSDPALDFMKGLRRLPPLVADAILDHVTLLGESANPRDEFAASDSLLIYLQHPGAVITVLFVVYENDGDFIFAIPFQCTAATHPIKQLYIEGLWILQNPADM